MTGRHALRLPPVPENEKVDAGQGAAVDHRNHSREKQR
ncbi:hypothetical protein HNR76_001141 [Pseudoxanthomonas broegbernensis]|nr:hypothetical protein [Pseudoxanthomonas broegbernensis]